MNEPEVIRATAQENIINAQAAGVLLQLVEAAKSPKMIRSLEEAACAILKGIKDDNQPPVPAPTQGKLVPIRGGRDA